MAAGRRRLNGPSRGLALSCFALLASACGGLAPGGRAGPIVDVEGVGAVVVVEPQLREPEQTTRWTGARAVLQTEDGRLLVVWNGGRVACWGLESVHFTGRGRQVAASVAESETPHPGSCAGERSLLAVFAPGTAAPVRDGTSEWPVPP